MSVTDALDTFDVVVTGFDAGGEPPASRLQRVFGLTGPAAERLLARLPAPVQRGVPRIRAEYFRRALLKIGAHVEVRDGQGAPVELLPTVPPPAPHRVSQRPSHGAPNEGFALHDDAPLAASLRPGSLPAPAAAPLELDDAPPSPEAFTASVRAGAIADTLIDSRHRPSTTEPVAQQVWANAATALPGPAPAAKAPPDALADAAVRMPAHPTLRDGVPVAAPAMQAAASPWGSLSTQGAPAQAPAVRAGATVVHGAAVAPQPAAFAAAGPTRTSAAPAFKPPPLELGLDSGKVMSKLPSSIWDPPPPAHPNGDGAPPGPDKPLDLSLPKRTGGTLLDLPGASAGSLDLTGAAPRATGSIDGPLELPSIAPAKGRAPLNVPRPQPAPAREPASLGTVASDAPEPGPRPRKKSVDRKGAARTAPQAESRRAFDFWGVLASSLARPWSGTGGLWVGVIALWGVVGSSLIAATTSFAPLSVVIALCALTILLALSCDYFRACFRLAETEDEVLERAPTLEPSRVLHGYLKSGAQLTVFALVTGLPLIFVTIAGIAEGATPLGLFASPSTWFLGFLSALMWPGAVAMSALHDRFEAVWQLPRALALLVRAPAEYLAIAVIGGLSFGLGVLVLLALCSALGVSGALLCATLGLPMALGHGLQGVLMGNLMRARPELFR